MRTGRTSALGGVDGFNVFTLGHGTLVTAQTSLGELVHALVGRGSSGLDHVEDATFVRGQSHHFAGNFSTQLGAGSNFLLYCVYQWY